MSPSHIPIPMIDLHLYRAQQALQVIENGQLKGWSDNRIKNRAKRVLQQDPQTRFVSI